MYLSTLGVLNKRASPFKPALPSSLKKLNKIIFRQFSLNHQQIVQLQQFLHDLQYSE